MKFYIEKKTSGRTGNKYTALWCDTGYAKMIVTMDTKVIMKLADITYKQLAELSEDTPIYLA